MRIYYAITKALEAPRVNASEVIAELLPCFDRVPWWAKRSWVERESVG